MGKKLTNLYVHTTGGSLDITSHEKLICSIPYINISHTTVLVIVDKGMIAENEWKIISRNCFISPHHVQLRGSAFT
jgi:hypothetical protein